MGEKMEKIVCPACSLKLKNTILFLNRGLIFFSNYNLKQFGHDKICCFS